MIYIVVSLSLMIVEYILMLESLKYSKKIYLLNEKIFESLEKLNKFKKEQQDKEQQDHELYLDEIENKVDKILEKLK